MVELKRLYGKPLGVLTLKMYYQRIFASCAYKDCNLRSGAPKMAKPNNSNPAPGDIDYETQTRSIEEAELANGTYYDQAVELLPRTYSIGSLSSSEQLSESGLGLPPSRGTDPYFRYAYPDTSFGDTYYTLTAYNRTTLSGIPNTNENNSVEYLYPLCVTVPAKITINMTNNTASFTPRQRGIELGFFVEGESGTIKLSLGNWESPDLDIKKYKPLTALSSSFDDFESTLGQPVDGESALNLYPNLHIRSSVTQIATNPKLTDEHCGGIRDQFFVDVVNVNEYHEHQFLPTVLLENPLSPQPITIDFEYTCDVELVGHYVDLTLAPWAGKYTSSQNILGPGYMELVLGQWKVISLTVPDNLVPISGAGGISGEY